MRHEVACTLVFTVINNNKIINGNSRNNKKLAKSIKLDFF